MKTTIRLFAILLMLIALPLGLYIWLKWGWYDGFILAFNAVMTDPKNAGDFAWGIIKILVGAVAGSLTGYITFMAGGIIFVSTNQ